MGLDKNTAHTQICSERWFHLSRVKFRLVCLQAKQSDRVPADNSGVPINGKTRTGIVVIASSP